jgi:hypothetical protein
MNIELEFFEYPKHKPKVGELGCENLLCFISLDSFETATELFYQPDGRYVFQNDQRFEFEPYITHWAYLPKKQLNNENISNLHRKTK